MKMKLPVLIAGITLQFICVCSVSVAQQGPLGEWFDGKREGLLVGASISYMNIRASIESDLESTDSSSGSSLFNTSGTSNSLSLWLESVKVGYGLSDHFILFGSSRLNNFLPGVGAIWFPSQDQHYYLQASVLLPRDSGENDNIPIFGGIGYQFHRYWTIDARIGRATTSSSGFSSTTTIRITMIQVSLNAWFY